MLRAPGGQRGQPLRCSQQFGALPANEASPLVPCCLLMLQARRVRRQLHVPGVLICRLPPWAQRCPDARARADVLGRRADCTWSHTIRERGSGGGGHPTARQPVPQMSPKAMLHRHSWHWPRICWVFPSCRLCSIPPWRQHSWWSVLPPTILTFRQTDSRDCSDGEKWFAALL